MSTTHFLRAMTAILSLAVAIPASAQCTGDINNDGVVNGGDLGTLLSWWGLVVPANPVSVASDLNGDGQISGADLGLVLSNWGYCQALINSVSPAFGVPQGGTQITIEGRNLSLTTGVRVGGLPATAFTVVSATRVTATTPRGVGGSNVDVEVLSPQGSAVASNAFRYVMVPAWATLVELVPDPAVVPDSAMRAAIVASGFAWRVYHSSTGVEMLLVPPSIFEMGCGASTQGGCPPEELPAHLVTLTSSYYLGRYEITQGQFLNTMNYNPAFFSIWWYSPGMPVEQVTWNGIQEYLARTGMRLPTEAEWECACRAGTTSAFYDGSDNDAFAGNLGWCGPNSIGLTHGVGGKQPNRLGFFDMVGNVWEWVADFYGPYSPEPQVNPVGPASGTRVLRGGSFTDGPGALRSSSRAATSPNTEYYRNGGFRVARNP